MQLFNEIAELRQHVRKVRTADSTVGFVPTMGALHAGHAELIRVAKSRTDFVVVSIFVNPTQFGPNEDFAKYPRTLAADQAVCQEAGASVIFAPGVEEIYPAGSSAFVDMTGITDVLEGPSRPGHFRGVCTVVLKLFQMVQPDVAFFGAKDAQQCRVVKQMVRDLNVPIAIEIVPTVREADGLAMSSRNRYLSAEERTQAPKIYQALYRTAELAKSQLSEVAQLESLLQNELLSIPGVQLDYARIVDDVTLAPLERVNRPALITVAVRLGKTRLIDNISLP